MSQLDIFPSLNDDQKEFVSNLATMKDGKVGFDIPKSMVERLGLQNVKDGFVGLSDLSDKQILQLQEMQASADKETPMELARNQYNETTKILNVATAIYLRMMDDTRKGPIGQTASAGMKAASDFMQTTFNPSEDDSGETLKKVAGAAISAGGEASAALVDYMKNLSPEMIETLGLLKKKLSEATKDINLEDIKNKTQEILEKGGDKAKEAYDEIKKFFGELTVKVDINSNSSELAGIIVSEISRNPQLRADLASNIVKNTKNYT